MYSGSQKMLDVVGSKEARRSRRGRCGRQGGSMDLFCVWEEKECVQFYKIHLCSVLLCAVWCHGETRDASANRRGNCQANLVSVFPDEPDPALYLY